MTTKKRRDACVLPSEVGDADGDACAGPWTIAQFLAFQRRYFEARRVDSHRQLDAFLDRLWSETLARNVAFDRNPAGLVEQ